MAQGPLQKINPHNPTYSQEVHQSLPLSSAISFASRQYALNTAYASGCIALCRFSTSSQTRPHITGALLSRIQVALNRSSVGFILVLAISLCSIDAFFRGKLPDWREKPLVADLVSDEVRNVILDLVDLVYSGDFRFGEGI